MGDRRLGKAVYETVGLLGRPDPRSFRSQERLYKAMKARFILSPQKCASAQIHIRWSAFLGGSCTAPRLIYSSGAGSGATAGTPSLCEWEEEGARPRCREGVTQHPPPRAGAERHRPEPELPRAWRFGLPPTWMSLLTEEPPFSLWPRAPRTPDAASRVTHAAPQSPYRLAAPCRLAGRPVVALTGEIKYPSAAPFGSLFLAPSCSQLFFFFF